MKSDQWEEAQALKVGVLTLHRCINYGSYWQARLLVAALRERGHDAVLLDHYSRRVNLAEWRCALRPVLPTPVPAFDYTLYKEKARRFFRAFEALPCSPCFPLESPAEMERYDLVIAGSDEVWNLSHPWYGGCPLFFGEGVQAERLVSYAASFGNYRAVWGLPQRWADLLGRFERVSVRDENSRSIIAGTLGHEPELALDPCLQFAGRTGDEDGRAREPMEPYVAVYGHNFSEWFSREVRRWAASRGLRLVSIGYRNDWAAHQWLTAGPDEFAQFMAGATAIVTNFFHGCVFALRNERPFVCEDSPYRSIKVHDLMGAIGGERHLVSEDTAPSAYGARLTEPVDERILRTIGCLRQRSSAFLDAVLTG